MSVAVRLVMGVIVIMAVIMTVPVIMGVTLARAVPCEKGASHAHHEKVDPKRDQSKSRKETQPGVHLLRQDELRSEERDQP